MEDLTKQFENFVKQCKKDGLTNEQINNLCSDHIRVPKLRKQFKKTIKPKEGSFTCCKGVNKRKIVCWFILPCLLSVIVGGVATVHFTIGFKGLLDAYYDELKSKPCLLDHNEISLELTRPLFNCDICKDLTEVPVEMNLSKAKFEALYAYSSLPVVVQNTTDSWSARTVFSFDFLKSLYAEEEVLQKVEEECQFFPYNTDFLSLRDVFHMSEEMSQMKGDKWYIGWSNCQPSVERELRKHYQKPSFLPDDSTSSHLDWIFMGGWGHGAPLHLDNVERPSWQAQLSGTKTWSVVPAPECESVCQPLKVTVNTGDIIVIDTNQWYHSTYIHPGKISITIGSEYD